MNLFGFRSVKPNLLGELKVEHGHDTLSYLYDIEYIPRMMRKIAKSLSRKRLDIDWVQNGIESFLILNSRFYDNLITELSKDVRKYQTLPNKFSIKPILKTHADTLSTKYHNEASFRRHSAAHGSNFDVVGIPQYKNQTLPKPMRFKPRR